MQNRPDSSGIAALRIGVGCGMAAAIRTNSRPGLYDEAVKRSLQK